VLEGINQKLILIVPNSLLGYRFSNSSKNSKKFKTNEFFGKYLKPTNYFKISNNHTTPLYTRVPAWYSPNTGPNPNPV
jgi:hypothetical protein